MPPNPRPAAPGPRVRYPWSDSDVYSYNLCPRQWGYRRVDGLGSAAGLRPSVAQRLGIVGHAATAAAYRAAATISTPVGGTMERHLDVAKRSMAHTWPEAGLSWDDEALVQEMYGILAELLASLRHPLPGEVVGVEKRYHTRTRRDGGVPFTWQLDLLTREVRGDEVVPNAYVITDWKLGRVDDQDITRNRQLLTYAGMLLVLLPQTRRITVRLHSIRHRHVNEAPADPEMIAAMLDAVEATAARAEADEVRPARPGEHCRSCFAHLICPASAAPYPSPGEIVEAGETR